MKRTAFTLVELLVVIAIVGILIGILLPAVQMVREAARRAACQNNIKQVSLALENYHSTYNRYPRGWKSDTGWGWLSYTLPFLENTAIHKQIDFDVQLTDLDHRQVIQSHMGFLMCPSTGDPDIETFQLSPVESPTIPIQPGVLFPVEVSRAQYVGSIGSTFTPSEYIPFGT